MDFAAVSSPLDIVGGSIVGHFGAVTQATPQVLSHYVPERDAIVRHLKIDALSARFINSACIEVEKGPSRLQEHRFAPLRDGRSEREMAALPVGWRATLPA